MSPRSLSNGFSLAETMVAAGLFAVISLVLSQFLVAEMRFCRKASARLGLEREQLLLQESLRQDLLSSASAGISLNATQSGLALQAIDDVGPDGVLKFSDSRLVAYRYESDQFLYRYSWQTNPPFVLKPRPERLSPTQWAGLLVNPPQRKTIWKSLSAFRVRSEASPQEVTQRLWVDCTWQDEKGPWMASYCMFTRQNP